MYPIGFRGLSRVQLKLELDQLPDEPGRDDGALDQELSGPLPVGRFRLGSK